MTGWPTVRVEPFRGGDECRAREVRAVCTRDRTATNDFLAAFVLDDSLPRDPLDFALAQPDWKIRLIEIDACSQIVRLRRKLIDANVARRGSSEGVGCAGCSRTLHSSQVSLVMERNNARDLLAEIHFKPDYACSCVGF